MIDERQVFPAGNFEDAARRLNCIRRLRSGNMKGVAFANHFGRVVAQELSGVDLGAVPLPEGDELTAATLQLWFEQNKP